ncbi:MAG: deoxyguanosinetriphosphate triphosphohydrolase [Deltaproteobacteria bacterium RIFCSPLOWO2_02_FULL_50_16]|nr:MAG: deoxyguanosinetriphosphate triphosphohydrolase [Deltaproteobacteria bacterium RIFCSPLOWO2_02_FULL_50_16]
MLLRKNYEEIERENLASYAMKSQETQGRIHPEEEHPYRTAFQRDRDRIIHSNAFRRLEYKTQVFVYHEGDHFRTRLTHTIEGAQISRTVARALRLNEDLAEAIILAHDLGHTPFGHSGETTMNELMKDEGGFEHNGQSLRIVTLLEDRYPEFPGLNLTFEVLEGISKHSTPYDFKQKQEGQKGQATLEAQIVNIADEIAYSNHDLDDGLRSGLISLQQLEEVDLWRENYKGNNIHDNHDQKVQIRQTIKAIINLLVTDLVTQTEKNIQDNKIESVAKIRKHPSNLAHFNQRVDQKNQQLKDFLNKNLYHQYRVERMADKARRIIRDLFEAYVRNPKILPQDVYQKIQKGDLRRHVCDHIAGMTDRFALDEHTKLFDPHSRV